MHKPVYMIKINHQANARQRRSNLRAYTFAYEKDSEPTPQPNTDI